MNPATKPPVCAGRLHLSEKVLPQCLFCIECNLEKHIACTK